MTFHGVKEALTLYNFCCLLFYRSNSHESGIEFADEDSAGADDDDFEEPLTALGTAKALYPFEGTSFLLFSQKV